MPHHLTRRVNGPCNTQSVARGRDQKHHRRRETSTVAAVDLAPEPLPFEASAPSPD